MICNFEILFWLFIVGIAFGIMIHKFSLWVANKKNANQ